MWGEAAIEQFNYRVGVVESELTLDLYGVSSYFK